VFVEDVMEGVILLALAGVCLVFYIMRRKARLRSEDQ
jgi:hypothetical protein